jgi:hypothetical protein
MMGSERTCSLTETLNTEEGLALSTVTTFDAVNTRTWEKEGQSIRYCHHFP